MTWDDQNACVRPGDSGTAILGSRANGLSPRGTDSAPGGGRPKPSKPVELRIREGMSVMAGKEML